MRLIVSSLTLKRACEHETDGIYKG